MTLNLIILFVVIIGSSAFAWGSFVNQLFQLKLNPVFLLALGFSIILGLSNLLAYPIIYFRLSSNLLFYFYFGLLGIPYVLVFFKHTKITRRFSWMFWGGLSVYLCFMIIVATKRGLAEQSFDTVTYLSSILENAYSSSIGQFKPNTGLIAKSIDPSNDYQSYYHFGSFLIKLSDKIILLTNQTILSITSHVVMWVMSVIYFILNFTLTVGYIEELKVKKVSLKAFLTILILGFFAHFYYNNVFTFYGNTYRYLITGFLSFLIFRSVSRKILDLRNSVVLACVGSALISTSSSGYFIVFILFYVYVMNLFLQKEDKKAILDNIAILIVPIVVFVSFFLMTQNPQNRFPVIVAVSLGYGILFGYRFLSGGIREILFHILEVICLYGIPSMILIVSILNSSLVENWFQTYFVSYSYKDMVWDYFRFDDFKHIYINLLLLGSVVWFIFKSKSEFRCLIILMLLVFVNPISFVVLSRYLAGNVFYRAFDVVFNTFTILLYLVFMFESIKWEKVQWLTTSIALTILLILTYTQVTTLYHFYFTPSDDFEPLYRISEQKADVMSILKTTVIREGYTRAKVVSQIHAIKGFVPKIETPLDYHTYRKLDLYSTDTKEISPLWNIFIFREYSEMSVFDTPPDYENTCNYLYDERIDFVLVDKKQFYVKDDQYYLLHHHVRGCSELIYQNDVYLLYQLEY